MGLGLRAGRFCHHLLVTHHALCDYWTILTINKFIFLFLLKNMGAMQRIFFFQKKKKKNPSKWQKFAAN
jgi:hypothetical protein